MQCEACKNTSVDLLKDDKLLPTLSKTDSRRITVLFALLTDVLKTAKVQKTELRNFKLIEFAKVINFFMVIDK